MDTKRKYQIFISSTYEELKNHRKGLINRILELGHFPSGMELFSAGNVDEFEVIKKAIDQSDIYVILIGSQYGSTKYLNGQNKSYTQLEFEYAQQNAKKPTIVFVLNEEEFEERRREINKDNHKDKSYDEQMRKFRSQAMERRIVKFFSLSDNHISDLCLSFDSALYNLIEEEEKNIAGYVRGDLFDEISHQVRLLGPVGETDITREIVEELNKFDLVAERMKENSDLKVIIAKFFWKNYGGKIFLSGHRDIYFESGSTIAYLSRELLRRLLDKKFGTDFDLFNSIKIQTNNIFTYLQFMLKSGVKINLVPYGPPGKKYGATYGDFTKLVSPPPPPNGPHEILPNAKKIITTVCEEALRSRKERKKIFLHSASGIELNESAQYPGPHMGMYHNMLLKRAIYETKSPAILFVDESKIDGKFCLNRCYPVCTPSLNWNKICDEYPIGICFGAKSEDRYIQIANKLRKYSLLSELKDEPIVYNYSDDKIYCGFYGNSYLFDQLNNFS